VTHVGFGQPGLQPGIHGLRSLSPHLYQQGRRRLRLWRDASAGGSAARRGGHALGEQVLGIRVAQIVDPQVPLDAGFPHAPP
jgi:hypothetical protein